MFTLNSVLFKYSKQNSILHKCFCSTLLDTHPINPKNNDMLFFRDLFGTSYVKTSEILERNKLFKKCDKEALRNSAAWLTRHNYSIKEIQKHPQILLQCTSTLENHFEIFNELGTRNIIFQYLVRYVSIMNKTVNTLRSHNVIPENIDIIETLSQQLHQSKDMPLVKCDLNQISAKRLRQIILNSYLTHALDYTPDELDRLWKTYPRLKHKSYSSLNQVLDLLKNNIGFTNERIKKNGYVLHADPENIRNILNEITKIGDWEIRDVLVKRPKIIMTKCDSIKLIVKYLQDFGIPDSSIDCCWEIFTLGPSTVLERLNYLKNIKEFSALTNNPRIVRLVHYQKKARLRLDYLQQVKIKCASLHILSATADAFEKYARDGTDKTKGRDVIVLLSKYFKKSFANIRGHIARHPNWTHVPLLSVKATLDFLIEKRFSSDEIYKNVFILLYPIKIIDEKLQQIRNDPEIMEHNVSQTQLLGLCLYYIELEYHFTGDGIWEEPFQQIDTFVTPLPEIPVSLTRSYRYGQKPPEPRKELLQNL